LVISPLYPLLVTITHSNSSWCSLTQSTSPNYSSQTNSNFNCCFSCLIWFFMCRVWVESSSVVQWTTVRDLWCVVQN
jgi:hypothetical protein